MTAMVLFSSVTIGVSAETKYVDYNHKEEVQNYDYLDQYLSDDADLSGMTVILSTNDVHGAIDKYPYVAALKKEFQKKTDNVLLVDCGDFSQDKTSDHTEDSLGVVNATEGSAAIQSMNAAKYDLATLGNHEFEHGVSKLVENLKAANFGIVSSNITDENNKLSNLYTPFRFYDMNSDAGSVRIGFIGLTTYQVGNQEGISFSKKQKLYDDAKKQIDYLKGAKAYKGSKIDKPADIIICLSHLGLENEVRESRSIDLYEKVQGIDVVLDAHSHTLISAGENDEPIMSGEMQLHNIGVIIIDNESKTIKDRFLLSKDGRDTNGDGIGDGNGYYDNLTADQETLDVVQPLIDKYGKKTEPKKEEEHEHQHEHEHDHDHDDGNNNSHHNHGRGGNFKYGFGG